MMNCGVNAKSIFSSRIQPVLAGFVVLLVFSSHGCTNTRTTHSSRTGVEQLLISTAIDRTLDDLPMPPVADRKVYLEEKYLDCVDKGYVVGSIRHQLLLSGAHLVSKQEDSEITIEIRSGGVGTDNTDSFVGLPGMAIPGPAPFEVPEVRVFERVSQFGTAKLGLVAYETKTGQLLFDGGRSLARTADNRWGVLGMGPFQSGQVRDEIRGGAQPTRTGTLPPHIAAPFDIPIDLR